MDNQSLRKTEKPWGYELLFAHTSRYAGKFIYVRKGHRLSLQYHNEKDKTLYIHTGRVFLEIEDSEGHLIGSEFTRDHCYRVLPNTKHRLKALEDTVIFEVSTPELDDLVRLDDDYGRTQQ